MLAEIIDRKDNEINLIIKEEDISILYILQHEILNQKDIDFAGVVLKHPLIKEYFLRVISKGEPLLRIRNGIETSIEYAKNLEKVIDNRLNS